LEEIHLCAAEVALMVVFWGVLVGKKSWVLHIFGSLWFARGDNVTAALALDTAAAEGDRYKSCTQQ
jgi:hypothetical protein